MRIAAFSWRGIEGLADGAAQLAQSGSPADLVVVTGPSGSGKSRLLWTLVAAKERLAPYGAGVADSELVRAGAAAKVDLDWWFSEHERARVGLREPVQHTEVSFPAARGLPPVQDPAVNELLGRYDHDPRTGKLDYVPPDRAMPTITSSGGDSLFDQKRRRLTRGGEKYASIRRMAVELVRRGGEQAEELGRVFSSLCPHLRLGAVSGSNDLLLVRRSGRSVALTSSSSSEWEAFAIAATMVVVGLHASTVLYDTPEKHLSGAEAARRMRALREAFPATQWIVATACEEVAALEGAIVVRLGGVE